MAYTSVSLPAPAGNGSGAAVDVSAFGAMKTITVSADNCNVLIEVSNQASPTKWAPLINFAPNGEETLQVAARWMRATVQNYEGGGAPVVEVGGEDDGTTFATLVAPAGNGDGAGVDVTSLPSFKTVHVAGPYKGALNIEISEDGGTSYQTAVSFPPGEAGIQSATFTGDFMRVSRNGVPGSGGGTPIVNVGACAVGGGGGGGGSVITDDYSVQGDGTAPDPIAWKLDYTISDVVRYGAVADGVTDDREAIQDAIDAVSALGGGVVYLPDGEYIVTRAGGAFYCLSVPANVTLRGQSRGGTVIKQAPGIDASVRMIYASGEDIRIEEITLDGNKANQSVDEQRHGVFADTTTRLHVERVTSQNFTGDGVYLYTDADSTFIIDCYLTDNDRNGITLGGGGMDDVNIVGGQFVNNAAQQIDSEPGDAITNVTITGALIGPGAADDNVLTCSGFSRTVRSSGWRIEGCTINGPIFVVWCDDISFVGNTGGVCASLDKPHLYIYRKCVGVTVQGNTFRSTANAGAVPSVLYVIGTDDVNGDRPSYVTIGGNYIKNDLGAGFGAYISGAEDTTLSNNVIVGGGTNTPSYWGVYFRTTLASWPVRSYIAVGNHIKNFGSGAIAFAGSGAAQILTADVSHNTFDADVASVQPIGVSWNVDGSNAVQQATCIGNTITGNALYTISDYPSNGAVTIGGNGSIPRIVSTTNSPEGVVTAPIGSLAISRTDGQVYKKTSGTGNTGWVAVASAWMREIQVLSTDATVPTIYGNLTPYVQMVAADGNYVVGGFYCDYTGDIELVVQYAMSAANPGDVEQTFSYSQVANGDDPSAALTATAAFVFTPGNDTNQHELNESVAAVLQLAVTEGENINVKLQRSIGGDDTHPGDFRILRMFARAVQS